MTATIHHSFNLVCYWGVDRTHTAWRPSFTHTCKSKHTRMQGAACLRMFHPQHALMTLTENHLPPAFHLCCNNRTHKNVQIYTAVHILPSSSSQQHYLLCVWMWPLAQGPSPSIYHQSFEAIKHFSMRIARSSLSKTERSDSQSHFLPNPIKGGEGREGENEVEDLKWRAFI